jgi:hypothetical protein
MNEVLSDLGDTILEVLTVCCSPENREALEAAAEQRNISFEQLIAAATAHRLSEQFVIRPRRTPYPLSFRDHTRRKG